MTLSSACSAVCFFGAAAVAHFLLCRLRSSDKFTRNGLLLGGAALLCAAARQWLVGRADWLELYFLGTAWMAYLIFFINLQNSVTLRMLERLAAAPGGRLRDADFASEFGAVALLLPRLRALRGNGLLSWEGERLAPRHGCVAWLVQAVSDCAHFRPRGETIKDK